MSVSNCSRQRRNKPKKLSKRENFNQKIGKKTITIDNKGNRDYKNNVKPMTKLYYIITVIIFAVAVTL